MFQTTDLPRSQRALGLEDLAVVGLLVSFIYVLIMVAREWSGPILPVSEIHSEARYLPLYAIFSLARGVCAYGLSFVFTLIYGYAMARIPIAERFLLPILDVLQSIPVLGFLPGFVLSLVHLFPHRNLGLEIASVLMIFTGQAWNMTFSFYASLKSVPPNLIAVTRLAKLTGWQRFLQLDLAYAAPGLVWNSMMSMAGGWFFLSVSEAFVLGDHDFRLPGLGAYMSMAIERGDTRGQWLGALTMLAMIAILDQLVWRPITDWAQKFSDDESRASHRSWFWSILRRSQLFHHALVPVRYLRNFFSRTTKPKSCRPGSNVARFAKLQPIVSKGVLVLLAGIIFYGLARYVALLTTLSFGEWSHLAISALATFSRVAMAVILASIWAIPVGVLIGRNPLWSTRLQPAIQMAASFPAPMLFPIVFGALLHLGVGLHLSSIVLLMLGTQWYVLFNVIVGTTAIPRELWEVARLGRFPTLTRWRTLVLPAIFPSLLTGWITAMGGAWNASIVAEYMKFDGNTLTTTGLGATISLATEHGQFHMLAAAVGLMAAAVIGFNRAIWHPLSEIARNRFAMST